MESGLSLRVGCGTTSLEQSGFHRSLVPIRMKFFLHQFGAGGFCKESRPGVNSPWGIRLRGPYILENGTTAALIVLPTPQRVTQAYFAAAFCRSHLKRIARLITLERI